MAEQGHNKPAPQQVSIPVELREFIEIIQILAEGIENGTYKGLEGPEASVYWDDITWSRYSGIFARQGLIAFPDEQRANFDVEYEPRFGTGPLWEFELSREVMAQIASGAVTHLALYACADPLCGYMSSSEQSRCPRCIFK